MKKVIDDIQSDCDENFKNNCELRSKELTIWKKQLEGDYRDLRDDLKSSCYWSRKEYGSLDGRKIAAVLAKALMRNKLFVFNTEEALDLLRKQTHILDPEHLNLWAVNNLLINYKFAYFVSLQMVYLTLLERLLSEESTIEMGRRLNAIGHLLQYPHFAPDDSFDVNVIIGMARSDFAGKDFDMFLFAMQLYQIEMYTVEKLHNQI